MKRNPKSFGDIRWRWQGGQELVDRAGTLFGVLMQCAGDGRAIRLGKIRQVGLGREVFHQHFADALALDVLVLVPPWE